MPKDRAAGETLPAGGDTSPAGGRAETLQGRGPCHSFRHVIDYLHNAFSIFSKLFWLSKNALRKNLTANSLPKLWQGQTPEASKPEDFSLFLN